MEQKQQIASTARVARGAVLVGEVTLGEESSVWYNAVVRADNAPIVIGARSNIQDCCVLHVDEGHPIQIGDGVTVGHGAILHGCTIGDNSLIGMGAVVLNGAQIGKNCIIGASALVSQGMQVPDGSMLLGVPAKVRRPHTEEEIESNRRAAEEYIHSMKTLD